MQKEQFYKYGRAKKIKEVKDIKIKPNSYITGFEARFYDYRNFMRENFNPTLNDNTKKWFDIISNDNDSCGVHVRRGDLSDYNTVYGEPTPAEYFIEAIKFLLKKNPSMYFISFQKKKIGSKKM